MYRWISLLVRFNWLYWKNRRKKSSDWKIINNKYLTFKFLFQQTKIETVPKEKEETGDKSTTIKRMTNRLAQRSDFSPWPLRFDTSGLPIFRYINKGERYYHTRPTIKCKSFQVDGIRRTLSYGINTGNRAPCRGRNKWILVKSSRMDLRLRHF